MVSPYCTVLFSRKENIKFSGVAFVSVHCNFLIGCIIIAWGYWSWDTASTIGYIYLLVKNSNKCTRTKSKFIQTFFISNVAALRPTYGCWQGGSLTQYLLITILFQVRPKGLRMPCNEVESGWTHQWDLSWQPSDSECNVLSHCVTFPESVLETNDYGLTGSFQGIIALFHHPWTPFTPYLSVTILTLKRGKFWFGRSLLTFCQINTVMQDTRIIIHRFKQIKYLTATSLHTNFKLKRFRRECVLALETEKTCILTKITNLSQTMMLIWQQWLFGEVTLQH